MDPSRRIAITPLRMLLTMCRKNRSSGAPVERGTTRLAGRGAAARLQLFPWMHQVADLPHQRLVAIDERLGGGAILVETGRGHRRLDVADRALALGDARLEIVDARAARLLGPRDFSRFG